MSNELVSDSEVGKALDFLRDNAKDIGDAVEAATTASHMVKHIKALEMKRHEGSAAAQEREAVASDVYMNACLADAKAEGVVQYMKALREAAALKIEVWRSQSANYRSMKI